MSGCSQLYTWHDVAIVATFISTLLITYLSLTGLFGETNSEISDARPTPITPDGWAFSIWGIIFTGQAAAIIYLLIRRLKWQSDMEFKKRAVKSLTFWLCAGWAGEAAWTVVFARNTPAALSVCAVLLTASCAAFLGALHVALPLRPGAFEYTWATFMRHVLSGSIAINAAWLSVATTLGILVAAGANHPGKDLEAAGIALAVAATALAAGVALLGACTAYPLTLVWAFTAVATKSSTEPTVVIAAWACAAAMLVVSVAAAVLRGLRAPGDRAAKDPALSADTELQYAAINP